MVNKKDSVKVRFSMTLSPEVVQVVDDARGDMSRSKFVNNILSRWSKNHARRKGK
jgi:hypothetical protein